MGHLRTTQVDSDLDEIWFYVAKESGSPETADRLIGIITRRFYLLATHPNLGRRRDRDLRPGLRSFPVGDYINSLSNRRGGRTDTPGDTR